MRIILASQSPRRKELLSHIVADFEQQSADLDETPNEGESAEQYVLRLAQEKAQAVFEQLSVEQQANALVIGSDTSVIYQHHILGKPKDLSHSKQMLDLLADNTHQVLTSFALISANEVICKSVSTDVMFRAIEETEIEQYWHTQEPQDKAGSYAIQGIGGKFVKAINGSVSNVIGLPLVEVEQELKRIGAL